MILAPVDQDPRGWRHETIVLEPNQVERIELEGNAFEVVQYTGCTDSLFVYAGNTTTGSAEVLEPQQLTHVAGGGKSIARFTYLDVIDTRGGGKLTVKVHHHRAIVVQDGDAPSTVRRKTLCHTVDQQQWVAPWSGVWDLTVGPTSNNVQDAALRQYLLRTPESYRERAELPLWDGWLYADRAFSLYVYASNGWDGVSAASTSDFVLVQRWDSMNPDVNASRADPAVTFPELRAGGGGGTNVIQLADDQNNTFDNLGSGIAAPHAGVGAHVPPGELRIVLAADGAITTNFRINLGVRGR